MLTIRGDSIELSTVSFMMSVFDYLFVGGVPFFFSF